MEVIYVIVVRCRVEFDTVEYRGTIYKVYSCVSLEWNFNEMEVFKIFEHNFSSK